MYQDLYSNLCKDKQAKITLDDIRKFYYERYNGNDYLVALGVICVYEGVEYKAYMQFGEYFRRRNLKVSNIEEFESKDFELALNPYNCHPHEEVFELVIPEDQNICDF